MMDLRWYIVAIGGLTLLGVLLAGPTHSEQAEGETVKTKNESVIRTERLELVDKEGNIRATLTTNDTGDPSLVFLDKEGKQLRIALALNEGRPSFSLWNTDGKLRATLAVMGDGDPTFTLFNREEKVSAALTSQGRVNFTVFDSNGTPHGIYP